MRYNRKKIVDMSKPYFENDKELTVMYATNDGNFFYPKAKGACEFHARNNELEIFEISKSDLVEKKEESKKEETKTENNVLDFSKEKVEEKTKSKRGRPNLNNKK